MTENTARDNSYKRDQVIQIINSVLDKVNYTDADPEETLYAELAELKNIIDTARQELALERPSDIQGKHIPAATDELDEIVFADCCGFFLEHTQRSGIQKVLSTQLKDASCRGSQIQ